MGDMTKNFSRWEFECKCGCGKNNIDPTVVHYCQVIRDDLGVPVYVSSGCRCQKHNDAQPHSVKNSAHVSGLAADIQADGYTKAELGAEIKKLYKAGKLPKLQYCYLVLDGNKSVHFDIDESKKKTTQKDLRVLTIGDERFCLNRK